MMVQTAGVVDVSVTARPELAVAPDAIGVALNAVAPGLLNVIVCAAALMVSATTCDAAGFTPLVAVTVKLDVPAAVGVPVSAPPGASERPAGNVPAVTAKVGAGAPDAVNVWVYAVLTTPAAGGPLVNKGAADRFMVTVGAITVVVAVVKQFDPGVVVSMPAVAGFKPST